jgi:hypothetical protein
MQTITRSLAFVLVLICVLDGMPGIAAAQSSEPPPEILREFQHFDEHLARLHYEPAERRRQEEVLARRGSAAKARLLVDRRQFGAALTEAELIVKAHPGQVVPLLETLQNTWDDLVRDETHDNRSRLRALYSTLRARVRRLPRENAARVARPLVWLESALDERDDEPWRGALARFHKTYSDQDELALSQIEGMLDNSLPAKVEARLAFAKARPRTELAARALYNAAFDLSHNSMLIGERPGSDPTDRFLQVAAIAEDLETGGYPPCEWVTKAPALVVEFRVMDRKSHARDNIPRVLDAYVSFAKRHVGGTALRRGSLLYLFTTVIPEIVAVRGDVDREMDALFARLEHEGLSLGDVRLLRAKYVLTLHRTRDSA